MSTCKDCGGFVPEQFKPYGYAGNICCCALMKGHKCKPSNDPPPKVPESMNHLFPPRNTP